MRNTPENRPNTTPWVPERSSAPTSARAGKNGVLKPSYSDVGVTNSDNRKVRRDAIAPEASPLRDARPCGTGLRTPGTPRRAIP